MVRPTIASMSRKPKKGYFVRGEFVAEGSELDLELKRELKGTDAASKTDLKRESAELQALGEALLALRAGLLDKLDLGDKLKDAIEEAKRITNFEGKRRQMQFIGKLMRGLDAGVLDAVRAALAEQGFAQRLQFGALALEVGLAGGVGALELAFELQIEFAAFGHELATDEVAFFGLSLIHI